MDSEASTSAVTTTTFDAFNTSLQVNALKVTRNALGLPNDVAFHRSIDSTFSGHLDEFSSRVLSLTNKLLSLVAAADSSQSSRIKGKGKLEKHEDVMDNFHALVVDPMDQLLEGTDMCLDQFLGLVKPPAITVNLPTQTAPTKISKRGRIDPVIQHASYLQKPQLSFKRKVENSEDPWYPTLSHKYNAQVPLGYNYRDVDTDHTDPTLVHTHPYRYEITHLSYPKVMFDDALPSKPKDLADTPFTWVSTAPGFQSMLSQLRQASEIAVDLEHHSYRSYAGFLCLMQISTREEDWIIDTLALREELTELNEIFTDPGIVKVFHGADSDIIWLQQDFDLYIVNLFDTYHASKALEFPRHGLANLLEMYCDFSPDKRYQLADWRVRPLPKDMLDYARSDTHFLLYIYDNLRNALIDRAKSRAQFLSPSGMLSSTSSSTNPAHILIKQVLARSEETSLKTYEKEIYDVHGGSGSNGWDTLARKWNKGALLAGGPGVGVGALQRAVYQVVHRWRDTVAREEDESTRYILPNHFLFQLAEQPPADMAALLRIFHSVPHVIRRRAKELLDVIRDCVTEHLPNISTAANPPSTEGTEALVDVTLQSEVVPETAKESIKSTLWSHASHAGSSSMVASTSSLFGSTLSMVQPAVPNMGSFSTSKSSLFGTSRGTMHQQSQIPPGESQQLGPSFHEIVARINSTLVIAPSVLKVPQIQQIVEEEVSPAEVLGMQVEIPFVPASRRQITQTTDDSIVVVGRAKQKKRKRVTRSVRDGPEESADASSNERDRPPPQQNAGSQDDFASNTEEPFDFSSVPNILDDNPNLKDTKKIKRQKKQKNGGTFYGDFRAPPKARSELKSGNVSYTFK